MNEDDEVYRLNPEFKKLMDTTALQLIWHDRRFDALATEATRVAMEKWDRRRQLKRQC